jgi:phage baseplate assembly protein W
LARTIYQYQPINDRPDVAVGIILPFNKPASSRTEIDNNYASGSVSGKGVFVQSYTTETQAISNLRNLLLTSKGERYMQPNFGTNIRMMLFEPNDDILASLITDSLTEDITTWLPYIVLNDIRVNRQDNNIFISVSFRVTRTGANLVINIFATENTIVVSQPTLDDELRLIPINSFGGYS